MSTVKNCLKFLLAFYILYVLYHLYTVIQDAIDRIQSQRLFKDDEVNLALIFTYNILAIIYLAVGILKSKASSLICFLIVLIIQTCYQVFSLYGSSEGCDEGWKCSENFSYAVYRLRE